MRARLTAIWAWIKLHWFWSIVILLVLVGTIAYFARTHYVSSTRNFENQVITAVNNQLDKLGINARLKTVEDTAKEAKTNSDKAVTTAEEAKKIAEAAGKTADEAKSDAEKAKKTADEAKTSADAAAQAAANKPQSGTAAPSTGSNTSAPTNNNAPSSDDWQKKFNALEDELRSANGNVLINMASQFQKQLDELKQSGQISGNQIKDLQKQVDDLKAKQNTAPSTGTTTTPPATSTPPATTTPDNSADAQLRARLNAQALADSKNPPAVRTSPRTSNPVWITKGSWKWISGKSEVCMNIDANSYGIVVGWKVDETDYGFSRGYTSGVVCAEVTDGGAGYFDQTTAIAEWSKYQATAKQKNYDRTHEYNGPFAFAEPF